MKKENKILIAVYGSLRNGLGNHHFLEEMTLVSEEIVLIPFRMVSLGGFPGLVESKTTNPIKIEIYEVTAAAYRAIERLEGYPSFYTKAVVPTSKGGVEVYILEQENYKTEKPVESGDWVEFLKQRYI